MADTQAPLAPPPELTEGLTPSAAKRAVEGFHRSIEIIAFLDAQMASVQKGETCHGTFANLLEVFGDSITQLRQRGMLRRDVDASAVSVWFKGKAANLRQGTH